MSRMNIERLISLVKYYGSSITTTGILFGPVIEGRSRTVIPYGYSNWFFFEDSWLIAVMPPSYNYGGMATTLRLTLDKTG